MDVSDLSEPRRKRVRRNVVLSQPYPVPIATYTGISADNDTWRWYEAEIVGQGVEVKDPESVMMISKLGFFGELHSKDEEKESLVDVEDFDPCNQLNLRDDSKKKKDDDQSDCSSEEESDCTRSTTERSSEQTLLLADYEAVFLAKALGCLLVTKEGDKGPLTIDQLWKYFCDLNDDFPHRYAVYHHFRSKNWVVKDGTKYGNDFLLYKDGPPFYHATYSVRIQTVTPLSWNELAALNRVSESAAKELLIVQVVESSARASIDDYLHETNVTELLVKRWAPSQKREPATVEK